MLRPFLNLCFYNSFAMQFFKFEKLHVEAVSKWIGARSISEGGSAMLQGRGLQQT